MPSTCEASGTSNIGVALEISVAVFRGMLHGSQLNFRVFRV